MDQQIEMVLHRYFVTALDFMLGKCPLDETIRLERHMGFEAGTVKQILKGEQVLPMDQQARVAEYFGCSLGKVHYMGQDLRHNIKVDYAPPAGGCGVSSCGCGCGGDHA